MPSIDPITGAPVNLRDADIVRTPTGQYIVGCECGACTAIRAASVVALPLPEEQNTISFWNPTADAETAVETTDDAEPTAAEHVATSERGDSITQQEIDAGEYVWSECQDQYIRESDVCGCVDYDDTVMSVAWRRSNCYRSNAGDWYFRDYNCADADSDEDDSDDRDSSELHEYSTNVLRFFPKTWKDDALVFGVELEMEPTPRYSQSSVIDTLGGSTGDRFILKSDGSLDMGVELVTMPMTLAEHSGDYWKGILDLELHKRAHSGAGTTSCGIHVHINRGALSALTLGKMLVLCNSERQPMVRFLEVVAQRKMNSWAQRSQKKITDGKQTRSDHYEILSLSGKHTAELRMFRGNLRSERVVKNVEFCHALVSYCRTASIATIEDADCFISWINANRHHYPQLSKFLAEKGILAALPTKPGPGPETSQEEI